MGSKLCSEACSKHIVTDLDCNSSAAIDNKASPLRTPFLEPIFSKSSRLLTESEIYKINLNSKVT